MICRTLILFCLINGFQNVLISGEYINFKPEQIPLILNNVLTNISEENQSLLQSTHPVMILAVSKFNGTISNVIEAYLQVFDSVLVGQEACSINLREEAVKYLGDVADDSFHCLSELNSQLLAVTFPTKQYVPLKECLQNVEKDSVDKYKKYAPTVKLCSYFLNIPLHRVNLDPSGIATEIRKTRISQG